MRIFRDLQKIDPPIFFGSSTSEDLYEFMDTLGNIFQILMCSDIR